MIIEQDQILIDAIKRMRGNKYDEKESVFFNIGALEFEVFRLRAAVEALKALTK